MQLTVRPARSDEHTFAWPMYSSYITDHIFAKHDLAKDLKVWTSEEAAINVDSIRMDSVRISFFRVRMRVLLWC